MVPPFLVHCGLGLLFAGLAIPLALRRVPMNRVYGVRTRKAFVAEDNWYELNAYGGKLLAAYGLLLFAFGVVTRDSAPPPLSPWSPVFIVGPLVLVFAVLALIARCARRLPDR